jgi:hypothetical protein
LRCWVCFPFGCCSKWPVAGSCELLPIFGQGLNLQLGTWSKLRPSSVGLAGVGTLESYLLHLYRLLFTGKANITQLYWSDYTTNKFLWLWTPLIIL